MKRFKTARLYHKFIIAVAAATAIGLLVGIFITGSMATKVLAIILSLVIIVSALIMDLSFIKAENEREREIQELNEVFISASPYIMNIWNEDIELISTSRQSITMFDLPDQESYIANFERLSPEFQPDGAHSSQKAYDMVKRAFVQDRIKFEWMHQKLDGTPVPCEIFLVRFRRGDKNFIAAYTTDLTAVKAATEKEREMYENMQQILDSAPFIINQWDENGILVKSSRQVVEWFGVESEEEYIKNFHTFAPLCQPCGTPSVELASAYIKEAFEKGGISFEWMGLTLSGELIPMYVNIMCRERNGHIVQYAFVSDLREIKVLERKLREQELDERTRLILETGPIAIVIYDADRKMIDCNTEILRLFSFDNKELFLKVFNETSDKLFPMFQPNGELSSDYIKKSIDKVDSTGSDHLEVMHLDANGNEVPTEV
ncbi:MAG: PAS domain-containing protein, partial [Defluviitaleaceae bacterium]|nr:PAS domain-containing protein [Defluviitaleaceae bacterium]